MRSPLLASCRNFEWDFDKMMKQKKAERARSRRRKDFDLINDDDRAVQKLVEEMHLAARADRVSNLDQKPAVKKRMMLHRVRDQLRRVRWR